LVADAGEEQRLTALENIIAEIIASEGPMPIDRYMGLCLGHPVHGYYMKRDPFGESGDFITAPEISQMFGELIGVWCAAAWAAMGSPPEFNLVELGPGRGTLMADILRAAKVMPGFRGAARVHLVEMSPTLRRVQKEKLGDAVTWHHSIASVPDGPLLLVANEFFDAIAIRQFQKRDGTWFERCVGAQGFGLMPAALDNAQGGDGDVIEFAPQRSQIAAEIGERLARQPGAALVIDYGHVQTAAGDTLQALRAHTPVSILDEPGDSDITSHVDFEALAKAFAGAGAATYPAITQADFLKAMGIEPRAAILSSKADANGAAVLARALDRLIGEKEMGILFKVMVATSPQLATPYPFGLT
jgi:NADH dehydrogenase [ubiquinone] 1 alpha subcomplex assembly factor 7